jgi:hypothetical protein
MLYVFGGHDEDNEKLSDLWKFDINSKTWTLIESNEEDRPH